jgi:hypothetical protein
LSSTSGSDCEITTIIPNSKISNETETEPKIPTFRIGPSSNPKIPTDDIGSSPNNKIQTVKIDHSKKPKPQYPDIGSSQNRKPRIPEIRPSSNPKIPTVDNGPYSNLKPQYTDIGPPQDPKPRNQDIAPPHDPKPRNPDNDPSTNPKPQNPDNGPSTNRKPQNPEFGPSKKQKIQTVEIGPLKNHKTQTLIEITEDAPKKVSPRTDRQTPKRSNAYEARSLQRIYLLKTKTYFYNRDGRKTNFNNVLTMVRGTFCNEVRFGLEVCDQSDLDRVLDLMKNFATRNDQGRVDILLGVMQQFEWLVQSNSPPMYSRPKVGKCKQLVYVNKSCFISNGSLQIFWLGKECLGIPDGPGVEVNLLKKTIYVGWFTKGEYKGYGTLVSLENKCYYEGYWERGQYAGLGMIYG